eukprot:scaffold559131_cov31-Prasinocladus_malaysianus.AAC.1
MTIVCLVALIYEILTAGDDAAGLFGGCSGFWSKRGRTQRRPRPSRDTPGRTASPEATLLSPATMPPLQTILPRRSHSATPLEQSPPRTRCRLSNWLDGWMHRWTNNWMKEGRKEGIMYWQSLHGWRDE